jgi:hypothetical protein
LQLPVITFDLHSIFHFVSKTSISYQYKQLPSTYICKRGTQCVNTSLKTETLHN